MRLCGRIAGSRYGDAASANRQPVHGVVRCIAFTQNDCRRARSENLADVAITFCHAPSGAEHLGSGLNELPRFGFSYSRKVNRVLGAWSFIPLFGACPVLYTEDGAGEAQPQLSRT